MPALWRNDQANRSSRTLYLFLSLVPARLTNGSRKAPGYKVQSQRRPASLFV